MAHSYDYYANWVQKQIFNESLTETPSDWMKRHRDGWKDVFAGIVRASGVFEVPALIISRWEFFGALYRGNLEQSGCRDAVAYAKKFLTQVNPLYAGVHNYGHRQNQNANQSDMFMMFRNKPFHGVHPAGMNMHDNSGVLGWLVDLKPTGGTHLGLDGNGNVHLDGSKLIDEFLDSMTLFAGYLNVDRIDANEFDLVEAKTPKERWLRAHWARYMPHGGDDAQWIRLGNARGIPA